MANTIHVFRKTGECRPVQNAKAHQAVLELDDHIGRDKTIGPDITHNYQLSRVQLILVYGGRGP